MLVPTTWSWSPNGNSIRTTLSYMFVLVAAVNVMCLSYGNNSSIVAVLLSS